MDRLCVICNEPVTSKSPRVKTCGKYRCRNEWKRQYNRAREERAPRSKIAPYTTTTDLLIVGLLEDGQSIIAISDLLQRDFEDLTEHIELIKRDGTYTKVKGIIEHHRTSTIQEKRVTGRACSGNPNKHTVRNYQGY